MKGLVGIDIYIKSSVIWIMSRLGNNGGRGLGDMQSTA